MKTDIGSHTENIECPECQKKQTAIVYHTWPWNSLVHECIECKYVIMESEWNTDFGSPELLNP